MARFNGEDFKAVLMDDTLYVNGSVTVPNPSYVAGFAKAIPQGTVAEQLILDFGWYARPGTWTQQVVEIPVLYSLTDNAHSYTSVLLRDPQDGYTFEIPVNGSVAKQQLAELKAATMANSTAELIMEVDFEEGVGSVLIANTKGDLIKRIETDGKHTFRYKKGKHQITMLVNVPMADGASVTFTIYQGTKKLYGPKKVDGDSRRVLTDPIDIK